MEIEVLLDASDFLWHLFSSLPYSVWVVVVFFLRNSLQLERQAAEHI